MSFAAGIYQQYFNKLLQGKPVTIWQLKGEKINKKQNNLPAKPSFFIAV